MAKQGTVKVDDRRLRALLRAVDRLPSVRVGVLDSSPSRDGGPSNAQIGAWHELGAGVPRRSWLRDYVNPRASEIRSDLKKAVRAAAAGDDPNIAFGRIGAKHVGGIQSRISNRIPPPLAQSTVEQKGSNVPLIDTGQFRTSITWDLDADY